LWGCDRVSDEGLQALASRLTSLTDLNLAGCTQVSDNGLRALAAGLTALTNLNLDH
jgi:hypothetical protein